MEKGEGKERKVGGKKATIFTFSLFKRGKGKTGSNRDKKKNDEIITDGGLA